MTFKKKLPKKVHVDDARILRGICNNLHCGKVLKDKSFRFEKGSLEFHLCPRCMVLFVKERERSTHVIRPGSLSPMRGRPNYVGGGRLVRVPTVPAEVGVIPPLANSNVVGVGTEGVVSGDSNGVGSDTPG